MQLLLAVLGHAYTKSPVQREQGQSTVEYILVTFAAATLALALLNFMGGLAKITSIFDKVIDSVLGMF